MPTKLTVKRPADFVEFKRKSIFQGIHQRIEDQAGLYPEKTTLMSRDATSVSTVESCRICGSDRAAPKHRFVATTLYRCPSCGFWQCHPVISTDSQSSGPSSIATAASYSAMILQTTPAQAKRYATLARRRYRQYCRLLGQPAFSMLEIGCGPGELGAEFMKLGVDYHGVNIDTRIVEAGQQRIGDRIKQKDFLGMEIHRRYNMVCFHQVLEHILDPQLFANKVRESSGPRGGVHGDVPNMTGLSSILHRISFLDKNRFGSIILPHHQFAYEPRTIQTLFGRAFRLKTFDVKINDPTWGQVNQLGCAMRVYAAVSGVLNAGTNLAFIGKRLESQ